MLWVALHLPLLSLESFAATLARCDASGAGAEPAIALVDEHRISAANAAAQAQGVKPGLKRATALALAPRLTLGQADPARDAEAVLPLAHAALAFTPQVSLQPACEPGAAARHGAARSAGEPALLRRHRSPAAAPAAGARAARPRASASPTAATAQGAAVLARVEPPPRCLDLAATRQALAAAPVWLLGPGREHWEALQGMGLRQVGDLLGLPRAGLARRFGETLLAEIDAAFGRRPDPREPIVPARLFESRLELFARADSTEQVLHGASILLARLVALAGGAACVRAPLSPADAPRDALAAGRPHAAGDGARDRARRAVARQRTPARPAARAAGAGCSCRRRRSSSRLQAEDIVKRAAPNSELFPTRQSENEGLTRLIERLQARLGADQVQRLAARRGPSARAGEPCAAAPTRARGRRARRRAAAGARAHESRAAELSAATASLRRRGRSGCSRCAEPLAERRSRPLLDGRPLSLLSGPERIEAGWWDAELAERDYFIAEAADGALVWIYRARLPLSAAVRDESGWFLHGRFG